MIWSIIQVVSKQGTALIFFAFLALLLTPADFGILGMAMVWVTFIQAFADFGFSAALIQRQHVTAAHFNTIFFVNIIVGFILTIFGIILSWPCAVFFRAPAVQPVMFVLSLNFLIVSFSLTHQSLAQKALKFKSLAYRDFISSLVGGIAGAIAALLHHGVWSLVIQIVISYVIRTISYWGICTWRPSINGVSFQYVKELWPYGSKIFMFSILKFFAQNIDQVIVGHFLGPIPLGLYAFAFKGIIYPVTSIVGAVGNYMFPKYSVMQNDIAAIRASYLSIVKIIHSVIAPLMVMAIAFSPLLVPVLFGQKWAGAIPLIQILAIVAVIQSFISPVGQLMKSLDRPGWLFLWSIFITALVSVCVYLGIDSGIRGAAYGLLLSQVLGLPVIYFILYQLLGIRLSSLLESFYPSIAAALLLGILLWLWLYSNAIVADECMFHMKISVGLLGGWAIYAFVLFLCDRAFTLRLMRKITSLS